MNKKVLVWVAIISCITLVTGIFFKQFFSLDTFVTVPTINFGDITMPSILAGGLFFWGMLLIVCGLAEFVKESIQKIKSFKQKRISN